jgi:hypothetical protein
MKAEATAAAPLEVNPCFVSCESTRDILSNVVVIPSRFSCRDLATSHGFSRIRRGQRTVVALQASSTLNRPERPRIRLRRDC